jgi:hypothetical protein
MCVVEYLPLCPSCMFLDEPSLHAPDDVARSRKRTKRKSLRLITDLRNNMTGYPPSKILVTLAACKDHAECCLGELALAG